MNHLVILPILIPLLGAALSLFVEHRRYGPRVQRAVAWTALSALALAVGLLFASTASGDINVYLLGDWPSRLGIALVADRLSAWMLLTTLLLAIPACCMPAQAGTAARRTSMRCSSSSWWASMARSSPAISSTCSCSSR